MAGHGGWASRWIKQGCRSIMDTPQSKSQTSAIHMTERLKVGTLCYATDQGLGILARQFYQNGIITDVMVVRHGRHPTHSEWYPGSQQITVLNHPVQRLTAKDFCASMDVMLLFETPFIWDLMPHCRGLGVKVIMMPMYECMHTTPPAVPDVYWCPSLLDLVYYSGVKPDARSPLPFQVEPARHPGAKAVWTPVPVDTTQTSWRQRTKARVFVHNAGHGGLRGRNGTKELMEAWRYVKSPTYLIVRTQSNNIADEAVARNAAGGLLEIKPGTVSYSELWKEGDVFVFPEKFNGLSLPLQEAHAAGMLVMGTDRFPMNTWLPKDPLIPTTGSRRARVGPPYNEFDEAILDPKLIAAMIDTWYDRDITEYSDAGLAWAKQNDWAVLGPRYQTLLHELADK